MQVGMSSQTSFNSLFDYTGSQTYRVTTLLTFSRPLSSSTRYTYGLYSFHSGMSSAGSSQTLSDDNTGPNGHMRIIISPTALLLGSAILPPSRVPKWNPRTPYVVRIYLSFVSDWYPPRFWTYLPRTVHHLISPSSLPFTC